MSTETRYWYLSSRAMTVCVGEFDGEIVFAPPIVARFRGQHIEALKRWMAAQGGLFVTPMADDCKEEP